MRNGSGKLRDRDAGAKGMNVMQKAGKGREVCLFRLFNYWDEGGRKRKTVSRGMDWNGQGCLVLFVEMYYNREKRGKEECVWK